MTIDFFIEVITDVLLLPLQIILIPIDALLAQIPGIASVPSALASMVTFVGSLPSTIVSLFGVNPLLWNTLLIIYVMYITLSPGINGVKKIWAWVRP